MEKRHVMRQMQLTSFNFKEITQENFSTILSIIFKHLKRPTIKQMRSRQYVFYFQCNTFNNKQLLLSKFNGIIFYFIFRF
ncbi:hypothetical protein T4B_8871 [Trichinella pseudospiralis]|uniref:Uncharacterized protein n=1 Tax=Trichinella pseudospiralis TaxID=6337 RepID=A0A0V1IIT8_TRIPS|nr:hypothetical protein T4B_8871 [Trichinella pseudospiralis]